MNEIDVFDVYKASYKHICAGLGYSVFILSVIILGVGCAFNAMNYPEQNLYVIAFFTLSLTLFLQNAITVVYIFVNVQQKRDSVNRV